MSDKQGALEQAAHEIVRLTVKGTYEMLRAEAAEARFADLEAAVHDLITLFPASDEPLRSHIDTLRALLAVPTPDAPRTDGVDR